MSGGKPFPALPTLLTTAGRGLATHNQTLNEALVLAQSGRTVKAIALLGGLIDAEPRFADAYVALGCCYLHDGRSADAVAALGSAAALDAYNPDAFANLALAHAATGNHDDARVCFDRALTLAPDNPVTLSNYAALLVAAGEDEEAAGCYRRALTADPNHPLACSGLAKLLRRRGNRTAAAALLHHATTVNPRHHGLWLERAETLVEMGRVDEALTASRQAHAIDPTHTDGLIVHGRILLAAGVAAEAAAVLKQATALRPNAITPRFLLAEAHRNQGDYTAAMALWSVLVMRFSRQPQPYLGMARALIDMGNIDGARRCLERVAEVAPDAPERHWLQAELDLRQGYVTKAWPVLADHIRPLAAEPGTARPPVWDGAPLEGRRLLVDARLTITDTILLARLLTLAARCGGPVSVLAHPALARLLSTVPGVAAAHPHPRSAYAEADVWCTLSGLAPLLAPRREDLAALTPSLRAPAALMAPMAARLAEVDAGGRRWLGVVAPPPEQADLMAAVLDRVNPDQWAIAWIAPAPGHGIGPAPLPRLTGGGAGAGPLVTLTADDPAGTAAALSAVDHVVAVDGPAAHLAGALGCAGHILVRPSGHWAWGYQPAGPWHPTLTAVRRAPTDADWGPALERLGQGLATGLTNRNKSD